MSATRAASRAVEVTLTEDRAHVRRSAPVALAAGRNDVAIDGVSPVLVDKTVRVRADGARVIAIRVERRRIHVTGDLPEDLARLEAQHREHLAERAARASALDRIRARIAALDAAAKALHAELAEDAALGTLDPERARRELERLDAEERAARAEEVRLTRVVAEADRVGARIAARRALVPDTEREVATLHVALEATEAGEREIELEYLVAGACWRPYHVATLRDDGLAFQTDGCVWQATGEDWRDVSLVFSTERPSLGKSPPRLADDALAVQRKQPVTSVEVREEEIAETGPAGAGSARARAPGIDDGGEVRRLRAARPATIPSDGRPHRVALATFDAPCERAVVAMPELAAAAILRTVQVNASPHPILAGPVDLVLSQGIVGRTQVLYVAPGARFELGWGPVPELRVVRTEDRGNDETSMLSSWLRRTHTVRIKLSNLGDTPRELEISERVPVSEIEKVRIAVDAEGTTDGARPDADGIVRWKARLGPRGRQIVTLRWVLERHGDVRGL